MSSSICISLVQMASLRGQLEANLQTHLRAIALSAQHQADVVMFPELSLTGYELDLAAELAINEQHQIVQTLSDAAIQHNVLVIAGCPMPAQQGKAHIGALLCFADGRVLSYQKQYLHQGEAQFCAPGSQPCHFEVKGHNLALAICADFADPRHAQQARQTNIDIYLASALITAGGYAADSEILAGIGQQGQCQVLLANYIGQTGGWQACGQSAIWNSQGKQVFAADDSACLVLCDLDARQSSIRQMPLY
ncbi:carbon-nitrogen hydrolase family protein [Bowmanella denitrificans]|uniref:Carbon-nitrogen hydrolase family protein n=1 Tax=Bowmanella denitrificans TaxID=366582 RepID=A0ABP3GNG0_9ALTE